MSKFDDLINEVRTEIGSLARERLGGFVNEAKTDAVSFLRRAEEDFARWLILLNEGKLKLDDVAWLAESKKDLLEMTALKQVGLSQVKLEEFGLDLFRLIIGIVFKIR